MKKTEQKSCEPYIWDINGEDYWIINENVSEKETIERLKKDVSNV
ncbi:MAG TPA: hypothetical protein VFX64_07710 [Candidatus Nitrosotalea sp.]|nr:hypothetical protein [Candidatus Nitrosotalea sp.]